MSFSVAEWSSLTCGVFGAGKTGIAVAQALVQLGARVRVFDSRAAGDLALTRQGLAAFVAEVNPAAEVLWYEGDTGLDSVGELDLAVVSPGIPPHAVSFRALVAAQVPVWSEVELAWQVQQSLGKQIKWLTITGTNGKTTTVGLVGAILAAEGVKHAVVGNVGSPVITAVMQDVDVLAVELSSFQLETTFSVSPVASVCLNVDADHLDWHGSEANYRAAKARVYEHTQLACVYDVSDRVVENMVAGADVVEGARAIGISLGTPGPSQVGLVENYFVDRAFVENRQQQAEAVAEIADIYGFASEYPSVALVKDTLAAIALTRAVGVSAAGIATGLRSFQTAKHRRAVIGKTADVTWIDDSKATNTHAAAASLAGFPQASVVWIAGGDPKGQDLTPLVEQVKDCLRGVVVIGADPEPVVTALQQAAAQVPFVVVDGHEDMMFSVVNEAVALSLPGDSVVLAPACASWDQFANYGERGDLFAAAVERLDEAWQLQYGRGAGK